MSYQSQEDKNAEEKRLKELETIEKYPVQQILYDVNYMLHSIQKRVREDNDLHMKLSRIHSALRIIQREQRDDNKEK